MRPLLVIEDIRPAKRIDLFTVGGVRIQATHYAWISLPAWMLLGLLMALFSENGILSFEALQIGLLYGLCLYLSNVIHSLGHIVAGKIIRSPMNILLLTSTRDVTEYAEGQASSPNHKRLLRSLGGPVFNIAAGLAGLAAMVLFGSQPAKIFALVNFGVGLWTLCPVPSMDGWVIWKALIRPGRR